MRRCIIPWLFVGAVLLATPLHVSACPFCNEIMMKTSPEDDDDPYREARAFNTSILFMLSMPYLLVGGVGYLIYCKYRKGLIQAGRLPTEPDTAQDVS